jgi:O-antigen ligase
LGTTRCSKIHKASIFQKGELIINRKYFTRHENKVFKSLFIIAGLIGIAVGTYGVAQSEWKLQILISLWGGIILLIVGLKRRTWLSARPVSEVMPPVETPLTTPVLSDPVETNLGVLEPGFYLFIASFAIGWRQIWITPQLRIHPSEIIIWGLFGLLLFQKRPLLGSIPGSLKVFLGMGLIGIFTASLNGTDWDIILSEFKNFLVIIPILYITLEVVREAKQWRKTLLTIAIVTFYISLLGLIEYFLPQLIAPLQGSFFAEQNIIYSGQGFARADFTFWGGSFANIFLGLALVPVLSSATVERHLGWRVFLFMTTVLCGLGIYVAGGRGSWVGAIIGLALYTFFNTKHGWLKAILMLVVFYNVVLYLLPEEALNNIYAVFFPEEYPDPSRMTREARAQIGINLIKQKPLLGHGWGGSGWVHSDLIQIGANLGAIALFLFLWWYLSQTKLLFDTIRRNTGANWPATSQAYGWGLFAALCIGFLNLGVQGINVLPPLIIPLWFLVSLAGCLPVLLKNDSQVSDITNRPH